jgi:leucyl/phenylalanyl-tRNA--protein transferase
MDCAFREVMEACREGERQGQTWIHDEIVDTYSELHRMGVAHSLEVWLQGSLVGGLYGISLGAMFFGESMFSRQANASKAALIKLCQFLPTLGIEVVDCQIPNDHLLSMGAVVWHRDDFLDTLELALKSETMSGVWTYQFNLASTSETNNPM